MTLAETYAAAAGVPLGEPTMVDAFYPLDHSLDRVVLIHAFAGATVQQGNVIQAQFPAKIYDHFNEVVKLIAEPLRAAGFKLFQIGGPNEPGLQGVDSLVGKTTYHQCAYLVKGCALLIGCDSLWAHVRGAERKPQVHIYGSTSAPHFPQWRSDTKAILLEAHRGGKRPTYASQEVPKTVSQIPPETIANAALRLIGPHEAKVDMTDTSNMVALEDSKPTQVTRQSLFFGEAYHQHSVELVPNCVLNPQVQVPGALIIRLDYVAKNDPAAWETAQNALIGNLQTRKCAIITDREINPNILAQLKPNIAGLRIEVDNVSADWIKVVKRLGIQAAFFSSERDPAKLAQRRLDLYDACLFDHFTPPTRADFVKGVATYLNKEVDVDSMVSRMEFTTHKLLLSDNKVYLSKAHWLAGQHTPTSDQNSGKVIDNDEFWMEAVPHFYIYTQ